MDWSILIGASHLGAGVVALWMLSFVLLLVVRFALCAEKWEGFITPHEWYKKCCHVLKEVTEGGFKNNLTEDEIGRYPHSIRVGSDDLIVQCHKLSDGWVIKGHIVNPCAGTLPTLKFVEPASSDGIRSAYAWSSLANLKDRLSTKQECLDAIKSFPEYQRSYDKYKQDDEVQEKYVPYVALVLPALALAGLADLFLYAFFMSPVVTLSLSGIVLTIACSRFLSSKLADNIKKTKENSDDIKSIKDLNSSEEDQS